MCLRRDEQRVLNPCPHRLNFEIPMYNVSHLQVKYLRIAEAHKSYKPYRWARYVTQSSSYMVRL